MPFGIAIHGGAGTILREKLTSEKEKAIRSALEFAIQTGTKCLQDGETALKAVELAIRTMEDNPLFNAGKGSVFTHQGIIEMDAAIMCGQTLNAGSVAGVRGVKNPITLAKTVLEKSDFIMLSGKGAADFAKQHQLDIEPLEYFFTEDRLQQLKKALKKQKVQLDHSDQEDKYGTVGAVALDQHGNLAAATSTGGMTNKRYGRIGDSPLIGIGTYANNETCAISCTGHGEYFMRSVVAYDIACLMEYKGWSLQQASEHVIFEKLPKIGGSGGVIAIDTQGNIALPFSSKGMYRASQINGEDIHVAIFKDDE